MTTSGFSVKSLLPVCRFSYDIALLRLESPAYDNGFVELALLPPEGEILPNNYPCYLTGWGVVSVGGSGTDTLQEVMLPVVDHAICSQDDWWGSQVKTSMICAGGDGVKAGCSVRSVIIRGFLKLPSFSFLPI
ncbi:elastase-1-like [Morphnus guianensis]